MHLSVPQLHSRRKKAQVAKTCTFFKVFINLQVRFIVAYLAETIFHFSLKIIFVQSIPPRS